MGRGVNKVITDQSELYLSGLSIPDVSKRTGVAMSTLRFRFKKLGILRSRAEGVRIAAKEGKLSTRKGRARVFTDEWKRNIASGRKAWGEINAKGVSLKPNGYLEITRGEHKGKGEHRHIMENHLGRQLMRGEEVHHIDGNRANNDIDNLKVLTKSEHARLHALENLGNRERDLLGRFL